MTSPIEITNKLASAFFFRNGDPDKIVADYMRELLMDMGKRYSMTEVTRPILTAAFKMQADSIYSDLDDKDKRYCDDLIIGANTSVQRISMPIKLKIDKED